MTVSRNVIRENLACVRERIVNAARRAGRSEKEITLIGVSKTQPAEAIREAYEAGLRHFGENRVQEWEGKRESLKELPGAVFHLIGHLQSNKATRAAKIFDCVDSVDDVPLAQRLQRAHQETAGAGRLRVLIEVHIANEVAKSGAEIEQLPDAAKRIVELPGLDLAGLMCIPPFSDDAGAARPYFRKLRDLRDNLARQLQRELPVLSMGMSHDFELAIEEGTTEVRVGTAIFGARPAK